MFFYVVIFTFKRHLLECINRREKSMINFFESSRVSEIDIYFYPFKDRLPILLDYPGITVKKKSLYDDKRMGF